MTIQSKKWTRQELLTTAILVDDPELLRSFLDKTHISANEVSFLKFSKHEDLKKEIKERNIEQIISEQKYIQDLNVLQWECESFHTYYILNCENPLKFSDIKKNHLMNKKLWEYTVNNAKDELAGGGWVNSYNREPFSKFEMNEFSENVYQKLKPYLNNDTKVLEIGCSTGLTMFKILPFVGEYHAVDLSSTVLKKDRCVAEKLGFYNVEFYNLPADDIDKINVKEFNIIILNSVIQCFHGYNYFREVLGKCINKLAAEGIIFLGDIMDLELKERLELSLINYKKNHPDANTKLKTNGEVFYPKGFFEDCMIEFPSINKIVFTNKIGTVKNELTEYRYDAILFVNCNSVLNKKNKKKMQFGLSF